MREHRRPRILIIGAGAMGIVIGYHLSLAGVNAAFLVRPPRVEVLERPQVLYCYDDNKLKEYKDHTYFTDPSEMIGANYDYIVITLDGASLRNEIGQSLVKTIGEAAIRRKDNNTNTKVLLGSEVSGLTDEQVTNGYLRIHAYPTSRNSTIVCPNRPGTDRLGQGLILDDSSPAVTNSFMEIYRANGVSDCAVMPTLECAARAIPVFTVFSACQLMGWPKFQDIELLHACLSYGEAEGKPMSALKELLRRVKDRQMITV